MYKCDIEEAVGKVKNLQKKRPGIHNRQKKRKNNAEIGNICLESEDLMHNY